MVDENDEFIEVHRANLENHHFEVELSYDADEALVTLKKARPDLVMIDMDTQIGSDGLHFVEKMTIDDETRKIPVLLFVSKIRMSLYKPLIEKVKSTLPTWSFLEKPVKIEEMIPQVNQLLNRIHAM